MNMMFWFFIKFIESSEKNEIFEWTLKMLFSTTKLYLTANSIIQAGECKPALLIEAGNRRINQRGGGGERGRCGL